MKLWTWTLDDWNLALQVASTVLVALTVITGAATIFVGKRVNDKQGARLLEIEENNLKLQGAIAEAKTRQAEAERSLLRAQAELEQRVTPLHTGERLEKFRQYVGDNFKDKPKNEIELFKQSGDPEAHNLAINIGEALAVAGWKVLNRFNPHAKENTYGEISIFVRNANDVEARVINDAFAFAFGDELGGGIGVSRDEQLPEGRITIVFGSRVPRVFRTQPNTNK